jgi:hypothetical protein
MNHSQDSHAVLANAELDSTTPKRAFGGAARVLRRVLAVAALAGIAAVGTGCYATGPGPGWATDDEEVVYADEGGYDYSSYPVYDYGGTPVYLVGDRWYYNHGGRWGYYRTEPAGLYGLRQNYWRAYGRGVPAYGRAPGYRGGYVAPARGVVVGGPRRAAPVHRAAPHSAPHAGRR